MTLDNPLEHFITRANKIHNNKFDYSKIKDYKNQKTEVEIICTTHGSFLQKPDKHLRSKYGCQKCWE